MSVKISKSKSKSIVANDDDDDDDVSDNRVKKTGNFVDREPQLVQPAPRERETASSSGSSSSTSDETDVEEERRWKRTQKAKKQKKDKKKLHVKKLHKKVEDHDEDHEDNDNDDDDDDDEDDGKDVDSESGAMVVDDADAALEETIAAGSKTVEETERKLGEAKKRPTTKVTPLAKPLLKPDAKYSNSDGSFDISVVPVGLDGKSVICIMTMLTIPVDDAEVWKHLHIKSAPPRELHTHSCGRTGMQVAIDIATPAGVNQREFTNTTREKLKTKTDGSIKLHPQMSFVYVSLEEPAAAAAGIARCGLRLCDLSCASVFYRVRVKLAVDRLGTFNYSRAAVVPFVHFQAYQEAMERAIPLTASEETRYCYQSAKEKRACLTSIPLRHNCAAFFTYHGCAPTSLPPGRSLFTNAPLGAAPSNAEKKRLVTAMVGDDNLFVVDAALTEESPEKQQPPPPPEPPALSVKRRRYILAGENSDAENDDVDEVEAAAAAAAVTTSSVAATTTTTTTTSTTTRDTSDSEKTGEETPVQRKEKDATRLAMSELFKKALQGEAVGLLEDENDVAQVNGDNNDNDADDDDGDNNNDNDDNDDKVSDEKLPDRRIDASTQARVMGIKARNETELARALEVMEDVDTIVRSIREPQQRYSDFYRPVSSRSAMMTQRKTFQMTDEKIAELLTGNTAEPELSAATLRAISMTTTMLPVCIVNEWEKEWGIAESERQYADYISSADGASALSDFGSIFWQPERRLNNKARTKVVPIDKSCMQKLGVAYRVALSFITVHTSARARDRVARITRNNIFQQTRCRFSLMLKWRLEHKTLRGEKLADNDMLDLVCRWWAPVLPEQFWRLAHGTDSLFALHSMIEGSTDDRLRWLESPTPHLALLSRHSFVFRERGDEAHELTANDLAQLAQQRVAAEGNPDVTLAAEDARRKRSATALKTLAEKSLVRDCTVWQFEGTQGGPVVLQQIVNDLPLKLVEQLPNDDLRRLLRRVAQVVADTDARFDAAQLAKLFEVLMRAQVLLCRRGGSKKCRDVSLATTHLVREPLLVSLFHPALRECQIAVQPHVLFTDDEEKMRACCVKYDKAFGDNADAERWATPNSGPVVENVTVAPAATFALCNSIVQLLIGDDTFVRFGVDVARFDTRHNLYEKLLEHIESLLLDEPAHHGRRFHIVWLPNVEEKNGFFDYYERAQVTRPHAHWKFVIVVWGLRISATILAQRFASSVELLVAAGVRDAERAISNKAFFYVPRADMVTHEFFASLLLNLTTTTYDELVALRAVDPLVEKMRTPEQRRSYDAFHDTPLKLDEATRQLRRAASAGGQCGDYLYLSGVENFRGSYFTEQFVGPSVLEDVYFACEGVERRDLPRDMRDMTRGRQARLRCWDDRAVFVAPSQHAATSTVIDNRKQLTLARIKFIDPDDDAEFERALGIGMSLSDVTRASEKLPSNVWLRPGGGIDGIVVSDNFGKLRSKQLDVEVPARIGVEARTPLERFEPQTSRLIFADSVDSVSMFAVTDSTAQLCRNMSSKHWTKRLSIQQQREPPHPSIAPSPAQLATRGAQYQAKAAAVTTTTTITAEDLLIDARIFANSLMRHAGARLERFNCQVSKHEAINCVRLLPTSGFSWHALLMAIYDLPREIVVVGVRERTLERFESERIVLSHLRTNLERHTLKQSTGSTKPSDTYFVNAISPLPFIVNVVQTAAAAAAAGSDGGGGGKQRTLHALRAEK